MAIASPSASAFCSSSFTSSPRTPSLPITSQFFPRPRPSSTHLRLTISSRLNHSGPNGFVSPERNIGEDGGGYLNYELQHALPRSQRRKGSPVFVTLPIDTLTPSSGQLKRRKIMVQSLRALAAAGVEGVVMEVWWGIVERDKPRVYDWQGYMEIVAMAKRCGLKVRAVLAFHQCGTGPSDPFWVPLPQWVHAEMEKDPNLAFSDRFGRRNMEYISLGCDTLPVLHGRSPIQAYSDLMRNFRDAFRPFLGVVITGIQVGMGPAGELRYPSCPSEKLTWPWQSHEIGEFQCYDKYMVASLDACARGIGMHKWRDGGPFGTGNSLNNDQTDFENSADSWNTPEGQFFLEWYSGMLLLHGERICKETESIFRETQVHVSAKVAGSHQHYGTKPHPSELRAGYYNTPARDGYLPIARMLGRYGFTMCCSGFEMQNGREKQMSPIESPGGFLQRLLLAARISGLPLEAENSGIDPDDDSFQQVVRMSRFYSDGLDEPCFSFNFVRMDKNLFEYQNWVRFTRFVREMADARFFRGKLALGGDISFSLSCTPT